MLIALSNTMLNAALQRPGRRKFVYRPFENHQNYTITMSLQFYNEMQSHQVAQSKKKLIFQFVLSLTTTVLLLEDIQATT